MKNIHVLPTDKPSRLRITSRGKLILSTIAVGSKGQTQNIYITNDEEIKEWYIYEDKLLKASVNHSKYEMLYGKPIILTTDQDLIKDGVQAIPDKFLEWFINNPSCEWVEVKCYSKFNDGDFSDYKIFEDKLRHSNKIIIPKEEPKSKLTNQKYIDKIHCECGAIEHVKFINDNIEEFDKAIELYKQETLEQANWKVLDTKTDTFIRGAEWMQERMYSEEEMRKAIQETITLMRYKATEFREHENTVIEQFKKK